MSRQTAALYQADSHARATSANTTDVKTLSRPSGCHSCYLTASTTGAQMTFDGGTPSTTNGLIIPAGVAPIFFSVNGDIKFVSTAAANSVVDVLWLK